ncbi:MAG: phage tail protein [Pyrinomonadaceae bacterium]|nr:phage tail protein [Sphingobacteriaceae bacterium]
MSYYPPAGFFFTVTISGVSGIEESSFQDVSGLSAKLGTEDIKEGGENRFSYRFPTPAKYENLVLKRGMLVGSPLINWVKDGIEQFKFTPKLVIVSLLDANAAPLATWNFINAYPVAFKISDFKAQENAIVVETLELAYNHFIKIL